ncbi:MAG TPA: DUF3617 family protein [Deltaproteobacteria bacterium]|nr:DUF3617 family protein [Deltaproteobacteria bacterium]
MNKKIIFLSVAVFILLAGYALAGPKINPGKWKITTTTEMAGIPPQTEKHTQCISSDALVPMSGDARQDCKVTDIKTSDDSVSWKIFCGDENNGMKGIGTVTYSGNDMNGVMNMTIIPHGTKVKNKISGQRIGNCDGRTGTPVTSEEGKHEPSAVEKAVADDVKDVGRAAKDEAKQGVVNEVRGAIRGLFK